MGYDVTIERSGPSAVIDLQGKFEALRDWVGGGLPPFPDQANSASESGGIELYWIGRERWLLRADLEREDELLAMTRPDEAPLEISVVLVSDTLQFFNLAGPDAGQIVSIGSPLDHHPSAFPENGVSYTDLFGIRGLLLRRPNGFEVGVERSYGDMIEDYLARANA